VRPSRGGTGPLTAALRLDPFGPTAMVAMHHLGLCSYFDGDYVAGETMIRRVVRDYPDFARRYPVLTIPPCEAPQANARNLEVDSKAFAPAVKVVKYDGDRRVQHRTCFAELSRSRCERSFSSALCSELWKPKSWPIDRAPCASSG